ncbi:hypothetical protein EZS27_010168 [termite gut metagenome]|uniref:Polymerase beta nucleotidyltransferase domain-containing protein n=1 Tax=termite gut metagenome TaxID=433724 RepID=A0A5J4S7L7_9ZZZZ
MQMRVGRVISLNVKLVCETAEVMLQNKRYLYVGFMCHQTIEKVFKAYKALVKEYFPVEKVYLFGSYAKDSFREDSDIDVAVVVNHIEGDYFSIHPLLWKLRRQIDDRIEPVLIERDSDVSNFLEEVSKHGIEIV